VILDTNALSAFVDGDAGVGEILRRQARAALKRSGRTIPANKGW
jgi:hypothetical protein